MSQDTIAELLRKRKLAQAAQHADQVPTPQSYEPTFVEETESAAPAPQASETLSSFVEWPSDAPALPGCKAPVRQIADDKVISDETAEALKIVSSFAIETSKGAISATLAAGALAHARLKEAKAQWRSRPKAKRAPLNRADKKIIAMVVAGSIAMGTVFYLTTRSPDAAAPPTAIVTALPPAASVNETPRPVERPAIGPAVDATRELPPTSATVPMEVMPIEAIAAESIEVAAKPEQKATRVLSDVAQPPATKVDPPTPKSVKPRVQPQPVDAPPQKTWADKADQDIDDFAKELEGG
jgi:hypothetical protein